MTPDLRVAQTILRQMGGGARIALMVGAKDFVSGDKWVRFGWTARAANKANRVEVILDPSDTYRVKFQRLYGNKLTDISTHTDVYAEDLKRLFENETKLYLSL